MNLLTGMRSDPESASLTPTMSPLSNTAISPFGARSTAGHSATATWRLAAEDDLILNL